MSTFIQTDFSLGPIRKWSSWPVFFFLFVFQSQVSIASCPQKLARKSTCSIIYGGQHMETMDVSFNRCHKWLNRMWYVYTMEYYSAIRKDEIPPYMTTCMDLQNTMRSKISQKKLRVVWFHSYVRYKSDKWANEKNESSSTHTTAWWWPEGIG